MKWRTPQEYAAWAVDRWADVNFDSDEGRKRLSMLVARAFDDGQRQATERGARTLGEQRPSPTGDAK